MLACMEGAGSACWRASVAHDAVVTGARGAGPAYLPGPEVHRIPAT